MSEQMMKWPDLTRFGLALGIDVNAENRRLCLRISDMRAFKAHVSPSVLSALKTLEFDISGVFLPEKPFYSSRASVKISDLQTIFPDFSSKDIKLLPSDQVFLRLDPVEKGAELTFSEWEGEVTRLLEEKLEIPTSDAQGIVEAQPFVMQQAWGEGVSPRETAERVDKASMAGNVASAPEEATQQDVINIIPVVKPFLSGGQLESMRDSTRGDDGQFFKNKFMELAGLIAAMPTTYETNGLGDNAVVQLHYFKNRSDWYVTEKDPDPDGEGQTQAYGYTVLHGDLSYAEFGYVNLVELIRLGVELDLHWQPRTLAEVKLELRGEDNQLSAQPDDTENDIAALAESDSFTSEWYATILAVGPDLKESALANDFEDQLDSFFSQRHVDVRNTLRELGWDDDGSQPNHHGPLVKNGKQLVVEFDTAVSGVNNIGISFNGIRDDLTKTPAELAAVVDRLSQEELQREREEEREKSQAGDDGATIEITQQPDRPGTKTGLPESDPGLKRLKSSVKGGKRNSKDEEAVVKIEDVGEKIGGARKDLAGRRLVLGDLEQMTEFEKKELVKKDKVFPPLDYRAMKEEGVDPAVAIFLKKLRDTLPVHAEKNRVEVNWSAGPGGLRADLKFSPEIFVRALDRVYGAVSEAKTVDELKEAIGGLLAFTRSRTCPDYAELGEDHTTWLDNPKVQKYMEATNFYSAIGRRAASVIYNAEYYLRAAQHIGERSGWAAVIKTKGTRTTDTDSDLIPERPHLANIERVGPGFREQDVTAEELMNHFGARAIEFGNWLPQDERQTVVNHAFDAISDLAEVLALSPAEIGLGGVGLAFGARGRGGKRAAMAHYEPGRTVVNLTRIAGAGSLAHEFAHAIDHYLGKIVCKKDSMFSETYQDRYKFDQKSGELARKYTALIQVISSKRATVRSGLELMNANLEKYTGWAKSWVCAARQNKITDPEKMKQFDAAAKSIIDQLKNGELPVSAGSYESLATVSMRYINELFVSLGEKGRSAKITSKNYHGLMANLQAIETCRRRALDYKEKDLDAEDAGRVVKSDFLHNAEKLDSRRSSSYWAKTEELFARAFECWVADTLASKGRRSDYLVHGVEEERYAESKYRGNPYPAGDERKMINKAMGDFIVEAGDFFNCRREENIQEKKKNIALAMGM